MLNTGNKGPQGLPGPHADKDSCKGLSGPAGPPGPDGSPGHPGQYKLKSCDEMNVNSRGTVNAVDER